MGIEGISRSQVSEMVSSLDGGVAALRERPLTAGPDRHLWLDTLAVRVREEGQVVSVAATILIRRVGSCGRRPHRQGRRDAVCERPQMSLERHFARPFLTDSPATQG